MFDLSGKAALVTGASGGIGGAIARSLHKQGATVALSGTRADALEKVTLATPSVPLVANVLASEITNPADIKQRLIEQVTGMVRWRESVQYMKSQGVEALVECGSGKVLSGLVKRIDKEMTGLALNTPADIEAFLKTA